MTARTKDGNLCQLTKYRRQSRWSSSWPGSRSPSGRGARLILLSTAGFTGIGIRETGTPLSVIHATAAG